MAQTKISQSDTHGPGFQQQDASAWISFDPSSTGHRRDVRSAAAKSSAAARKATIAKKLAVSTAYSGQQAQEAVRRPKKRRREQRGASPTSSCPSATLHSRHQSEISLASLASTNSPVSSGTNSPCFTQAPQTPMSLSCKLVPSTFEPTVAALPCPQIVALQGAVSFALGVDVALAGDASIAEPTQFGASRVKSRVIGSVHDAVAARRTGSNTLLAVALLAAWDLRFEDERSSALHLGAWHQLALAQGVLPLREAFARPRVTLAEAVRISVQCHLQPDLYSNMSHTFDRLPGQYYPGQVPSGREIVLFFDVVGDLVGSSLSP